MKKKATIQSDETATLRLAWPGDKPALHDALQLIHWFGAVGGRSRNDQRTLKVMAYLQGNEP